MRQNFAGKPSPIFYSIWDPVISHPQQEDSRKWKELDDKIKELIEKSGNTISGRERLSHTCKVCGKEGQNSAIKEHIEANHLEGISISCNRCDKIHATRHALKQHITLCHPLWLLEHPGWTYIPENALTELGKTPAKRSPVQSQFKSPFPGLFVSIIRFWGLFSMVILLNHCFFTLHILRVI